MTQEQQTLVTENLKLVHHVAKNFRSCGVEYEDLVSQGSVGLCKAAIRFDPSVGAAFSTFAGLLIRNEILKMLRGRNPPALSLESYSLLELISGDEADPLDTMEQTMLLEEITSSVNQLPERKRLVIELYFGVHGKPLNQREIAEKLGCSHQTVSKHYRDAINHLRRN